jgi:hypothetical protein
MRRVHETSIQTDPIGIAMRMDTNGRLRRVGWFDSITLATHSRRDVAACGGKQLAFESRSEYERGVTGELGFVDRIG